MKLRDFGLLSNENIHPRVIEWLRRAGFSVVTAFDAALRGAKDAEVLQRAFAENRAVLTHDADFGRIATLEGAPVCGIVYLRPGHVDPEFTIGSLATLLDRDPDVEPPYIVVVRRARNEVRIRLRRIP